MFNRVFWLRLALDGIAAGLLLFAFAYYWQGNTTHELAGLGIFLLMVVHNLFHRRWFATLAKQSRGRRGKFNLGLTFVLLSGMLVLLATSLLISETLFAQLRLPDDFTARQIHAGIAYWLLVIVAVHLGLRWPLLIAATRRLCGISDSNAIRTQVLRIVALGIAVQGVDSVFALNLPARLQFQMTLDWWNFKASVAGFFGHCLAIVGLGIFVTYYTMQWVSRLPRYARKTVE